MRDCMARPANILALSLPESVATSRHRFCSLEAVVMQGGKAGLSVPGHARLARIAC
jgi:hypothetical protein